MKQTRFPPLSVPLSSQGPSGNGLHFASAVDRFHREAQPGEFHTGRYRMNYYIWGQGPPLVFVHGASDTGRSFAFTISQLTSSFRCIAYDLPGRPGDASSLGRYRHEDLVSDLFALLDHLRLPVAFVLGSSFGGTIVLRAMGRDPQRFPRGILQGALVHRPLRRTEWWLTWLARLLPGPMTQMPRREKMLRIVHGEPFVGRAEEWWRAYVDWTGESRISTLGRQGQLLHRLDLRPELPSIHQPVLLVAGDRDYVAPLEHSEMIRHRLPHGQLVVLNGCGHVPSYTHPEQFADVIRAFLTG
ncbi:MAG: alpha/beta hydrolase [Planctomycetia bacterium]|nr:alpha/beta hydrolase [Planctomycetia bacterium]